LGDFSGDRRLTQATSHKVGTQEQEEAAKGNKWKWQVISLMIRMYKYYLFSDW
jgi:hypothetical protein